MRCSELYGAPCFSTHHHPRSRSSGPTGTTFASRARQREAIGQPLQRSRPASVASRPPTVDRSVVIVVMISWPGLIKLLLRSRTRSLSPRRFSRQSASPAPPKNVENGRSRRPAAAKPAQPREKVEIPVRLYPDKERTPSPRLIPINVSEEKMMSSYETSWNDRYLFQPIGPSLGRKNVLTEDTEDRLAHKESVYKQQTAETTRSSFLGKTSKTETSTNSYGMVGSDQRVLDTRGSSYDGTFQDSLFQNGKTSRGSERSSLENGKSFTQSSSSYSSYKKTNINGKESSSSSHYEQHSDSRDRNICEGGEEEDMDLFRSSRSSSASTTAANMLERQRRESSRKSSLAG